MMTMKEMYGNGPITTMTVKKPQNISIITIILAFKAFVLATIIIVFFFVKDIDPKENSFFSGVRRAFQERLGLSSDDPNYSLGYLIGQLLIPIILTGLIFIFLK